MHFFVTVLFSTLLISCDDVSDRVFENYERIQGGSWKLVRMSYTDTENKRTIDSSITTLSFLGNLNKNTVGKMTTATGEVDFTYNFTLENFSIDVPWANDILPFDAPGRNSIFTIKFNGKNEFEIATSIEHYKPEDILIRDIVYTFVRK